MIRRILEKWRYYTLGREEYFECMAGLLPANLLSLKQANSVIAALVLICALFPILVEQDIRKGGVYLLAAVIALVIAVCATHWRGRAQREKRVRALPVYLLSSAYYANLILFGVYIGVWSDVNGTAVSVMMFIICGFLLFVTPPLYNLAHTAAAVALCAVSSVTLKEPDNWMFDVVNAVVAGSVGLLFSWRITTLRLVSAMTARKLEEERNSFYNQSTIDELTQLKNRRDFWQTFQRRLTNFRSSDDWLCLAIADIDYFKNFNDFYGHLKGDNCLRAIGRAMNSLRDNEGMYAARVGGEEFALIWYEKETAHITDTVAKIQKKIQHMNIPHEKSKVAPYVTISLGIHTIHCGASVDIHALYDLADKALYTAKRNGRDQAVIYGTL